MSTAPTAPTALHFSPVPLWRQLQATSQVLLAVRSGQSTTQVLADIAAPLRPGVQALAFAVLRNLGRAQAVRQLLAKRAPGAQADALLCSALALATAPAPAYEPYVLVDQAVEAAKRLAQWNHPLWWIELVQKAYPNHWQAVLLANNQPPPMSLRINAKKVALSQYQKALEAINCEASTSINTCTPHALVLPKGVPVQVLPGFADGWVSVQDVAAQRAAGLLLGGMQPAPARILDACAAPGGKTAHLLELCDAQVIALDVDAGRCQRIDDNLKRLGLHATIIAADASQPASWWDGQAFDAILLDAPCTASGIVRRHPDVRWLRRASDVPQLAAVQAKLLNALWPLLKPGGRLLYCTCSVFPQEGQAQIKAFLTRNTEAILLPSPGHLLPAMAAHTPGLPDNQGNNEDGFFYALLEKAHH
jgi:16S rRNA (cytosine967-C5)-methyltransferase